METPTSGVHVLFRALARTTGGEEPIEIIVCEEDYDGDLQEFGLKRIRSLRFLQKSVDDDGGLETFLAQTAVPIGLGLADNILIFPYHRAMMACLALTQLEGNPRERFKALVVGVGGGALLRVLPSVLPDGAQIDAVEKDPGVLALAQHFFDIKPGPTLRLHAADGVAFLHDKRSEYDFILIDTDEKSKRNSWKGSGSGGSSSDGDSSGSVVGSGSCSFSLDAPAAIFADPAVLRDVRASLRPGGIAALNALCAVDSDHQAVYDILRRCRPAGGGGGNSSGDAGGGDGNGSSSGGSNDGGDCGGDGGQGEAEIVAVFSDHRGGKINNRIVILGTSPLPTAAEFMRRVRAVSSASAAGDGPWRSNVDTLAAVEFRNQPG